MSRTRLMRAALAGCLALAGCGARQPAPPPRQPWAACVQREADPPRTVVERPCGVPAAELTDGARTVLLHATERRFWEPSAAAAVVTDAWVRLLPAPFSGQIDPALDAWLERASTDLAPDALEVATQYLEGAPPRFERGMQIAGDADYGPLSPAGERLEGSDFFDYLGVPWTYADGSVERPLPDELHSLDCSGYVRMIWGLRLGLPLAHGLDPSGAALSRRSVQMESAPMGTVIIGPPDDPAAQLGRLRAGDLLFFDADPLDGPAVDHVAMYLGLDEQGARRFVSSRKGANGPTLGDVRGASVLDGPGLYARSFRSARRL